MRKFIQILTQFISNWATFGYYFPIDMTIARLGCTRPGQLHVNIAMLVFLFWLFLRIFSRFNNGE